MLVKLDANGDGEITFEEIHAAYDRPDGPPPGHFPPPPWVIALDTNADGSLSAKEIAGATQSLMTLDMDGDGVLSIEEICPPGPPPEAEDR